MAKRKSAVIIQETEDNNSTTTNELAAARADAVKSVFSNRNIAKFVSSVGEQAAVRPRRWCRTGLPPLDFICGLGKGIPLGVLMELWGEEKAGKTAIALYIAAEMQRLYGAYVFIADIEQSIDDSVLTRSGLDTSPDALGILEPEDPETRIFTASYMFGKLMEFTHEFRSQNKETPLIHIIDSVAALSVLNVEEVMKVGQSSGTKIASKSLAVQDGIQAFKGFITNHNTMCLACNQARAVFNTGFGGFGNKPSVKAWGPYGWGHLVDIRLEVSQRNRFDGFFEKQPIFCERAKAGDPTHMMIHAKCSKSKVATPYLQTGIVNELGYGIDAIRSTILHAGFDLKGVFDDGLRSKSGKRDAVVTWKDVEYTTRAMTTFFEENPSELAEFISKVEDAHKQVREDKNRVGVRLSLSELGYAGNEEDEAPLISSDCNSTEAVGADVEY